MTADNRRRRTLNRRQSDRRANGDPRRRGIPCTYADEAPLRREEKSLLSARPAECRTELARQAVEKPRPPASAGGGDRPGGSLPVSTGNFYVDHQGPHLAIGLRRATLRLVSPNMSPASQPVLTSQPMTGRVFLPPIYNTFTKIGIHSAQKNSSRSFHSALIFITFLQKVGYIRRLPRPLFDSVFVFITFAPNVASPFFRSIPLPGHQALGWLMPCESSTRSSSASGRQQ